LPARRGGTLAPTVSTSRGPSSDSAPRNCPLGVQQSQPGGLLWPPHQPFLISRRTFGKLSFGCYGLSNWDVHMTKWHNGDIAWHPDTNTTPRLSHTKLWARPDIGERHRGRIPPWRKGVTRSQRKRNQIDHSPRWALRLYATHHPCRDASDHQSRAYCEVVYGSSLSTREFILKPEIGVFSRNAY
jgi:hypothetical protein